MDIESKVQEILKTHGLDFEIEKGPLTITTKDGKSHFTPYYGLFNTKTKNTINTCKEGYTVSQNADVVRMILKGVEKFGEQLRVIKAGSISDGRKVFVQLEIAGDSKVGDDIVKRYITAIDSNDGSTGLSVGIGDIVMHCQNQFFRFYKGSNAKFRHTSTITAKIATIPSLIEKALEESMKQIRIYKSFQSTPLTEKLAHQMVHAVLGYDRLITSAEDRDKLSKRSQKIMADLYQAIKTETELVGENVWGLFNGLTRFTTHEAKEYKKENGKTESMLLGTNYKKAIAGFNLLHHDQILHS
jgi:hypothetical protein